MIQVRPAVGRSFLLWAAVGVAALAYTRPILSREDSPQRFDGFGVNLWTSSHNVPARDGLLRELHVKFVRASIETCGGEGGLDSVPGRTDFVSLEATCLKAQPSSAVVVFRDELARLGIRLHLVYWDMPAAWRQDSGKDRHANPDHLKDMARWLALQTLYVRRIGFDVGGVELANEPNGVWNTQYTPEQYGALAGLTRQELDAVGLEATPIEGPGTSNDTGGRYLAASAASFERGALARLSVHEYDTRRLPEPVGLALTAPTIPASAASTPIYVTEFGNVSPKWKQPPYRSDADRDGPLFAANHRAFAISAVGETLKLIADGASAVFYWDLEDVDWAPRTVGSGLLDVSGRRRPAADAFAVAFRHVEPGSRVTVLRSPPGTIAVAFEKSGSLTGVIVNLSDHPSDFRASVVTSQPETATTLNEYLEEDSPLTGSLLHLGSGALYGRLHPRSLTVFEARLAK